MSLKPLEVKTENIATYAVTESKLSVDSVSTTKIKDNAIKTAKIGDKQVTGDKIADRSISTAKIIDGAITGIKIAEGSITRDKISDGVLGRPLTPPVATVEIADASVTEAKLQNNSVTQDKIKDGEITNAKIASNTITAAKIAANAVGSSEIAANAVGYSEIASQSLEPKGIKTISGLPPTPGQVPAYDESQGNLWWFKWVTPGAAARPLTPPITTDEIGDGQVTPSKLSFTPVQLRVGFYDGDGNPSQVISGLGLNPQAVIIYPQASGLDGPYFRVGGDSWTQTISWAALGLVYGGDLILLGNDGFTVSGGTNTNGVRFSYIALG